MRPPLAWQDMPDSVLKVTQLFGGNPQMEAYIAPDGRQIIGHTGVDFGCPLGSDVYPAWNGTVEIVDSGNKGFGLHAIVTDASGRKALYGHLSSVSVPNGAMVAVHHPFAKSGSSGNSTGPHIHFEVRNGSANPANGYDGASDPLGAFDSDVPPHLDLSETNL